MSGEIVDRERRQAEQVARDLVVPATGGPWDHVAPLSKQEKAIVSSMVERLVRRPQTTLEAIEDAATLVDLAGATTSAHAVGLWEELHALARSHPAEFAEATASDLAEQCLEAMIGSIDASPSTRAGLAIKFRAIRDALAGPRPSAVEFHLAEAAALSWFDYYRAAIQREQAGPAPLGQLAYYDARVDKAHRRYVRSLKALAAVRKVDVTAVQINFEKP